MEKFINDRSHSWFNRYNTVGNFLMEFHKIMQFEHVSPKKFSRTYVIREHLWKKYEQIFIMYARYYNISRGWFDPNRVLATKLYTRNMQD